MNSSLRLRHVIFLVKEAWNNPLSEVLEGRKGVEEEMILRRNVC